MEARVAKLEADVSHLVKQVDRIDDRTQAMPSDLAVIKATMVTKWGLVGAVGTILAAVLAIVTFGERLQALIG